MASLRTSLLLGLMSYGQVLAKPVPSSTQVPDTATITTMVEVRQTSPTVGCTNVVVPASISCTQLPTKNKIRTAAPNATSNSLDFEEKQVASNPYTCTALAMTTIEQCWNAELMGPSYGGATGADVDVATIDDQLITFTFTTTYGATVVIPSDQTAGATAAVTTDWIFQIDQDMNYKIIEAVNDACDRAGMFMPGKRQEVGPSMMACQYYALSDLEKGNPQQDITDIIFEANVAVPVGVLNAYNNINNRPGVPSIRVPYRMAIMVTWGALGILSQYYWLPSELKVSPEVMMSRVTRQQDLPSPTVGSAQITSTTASACPADATVNPDDDQDQDGTATTFTTSSNTGYDSPTGSFSLQIITPPPTASRVCNY